jgi:hypothetical protein
MSPLCTFDYYVYTSGGPAQARGLNTIVEIRSQLPVTGLGVVLYWTGPSSVMAVSPRRPCHVMNGTCTHIRTRLRTQVLITITIYHKPFLSFSTSMYLPVFVSLLNTTRTEVLQYQYKDVRPGIIFPPRECPHSILQHHFEVVRWSSNILQTKNPYRQLQRGLYRRTRTWCVCR